MRLWKEKLVENAGKFDFPIHTPYHELTPEQKRLLWTGNEYFYGLDSFFEYIDSERRKIQFRVMKARYTGKTRCPECGGSRLRKEALYVRVSDRTIADLVTMNVDAPLVFFKELQLDAHDTTTARRILTEIVNRLQYLADVGLGYLTLDRLSSTLSGGESRASTWPRRWAATSSVRSTFSTNPRSACIRATRTGWWACSNNCATSATPSSWSNTRRR